MNCCVCVFRRFNATHSFVDNKQQHVVCLFQYIIYMWWHNIFRCYLQYMQCYCVNSNNTQFLQLTNIAKCSIAIYSIVQYLSHPPTILPNIDVTQIDCSSFRYGYTSLTEYEFNANPIFQHPMSLLPCTLWSSVMMYNVTSLRANWTFNNTSLIIPLPRLKKTCKAEYMSAFL